MKRFVKHKFYAQSVESDGIKFSSKKEQRYYTTLKIAQQSGDLLFFLMQVPFQLPGNVKHRIDFIEFWKDGTVSFTEIKGFDTPMGKLKRKQVEDLYPIKINVK